MSEPAVSTAAAEKHAKLINEAWQKTVPAIVETGWRIWEAKKALKHGDFENMVETMLNFTPRTAQRLMAIAGHPVLSKATHVSHLPPAWGTLAALARVDEKKLEAAIEKGTVHPGMERKDVAALLPAPKKRNIDDVDDADDADDAETEGDGEMPSEAEADAEHQETCYAQAFEILKEMTSETRRKFFADVAKRYLSSGEPRPKRKRKIAAAEPDRPAAA
jgi:Protein of unknown function (DUF3102)